MTDKEFASELVDRLNKLLEDSQEVRDDLTRLFEAKVDVSRTTALHPTIQVPMGTLTLSVLGLLNGLAGVIKTGRCQGQGHITALFDDEGVLDAFDLTEDRTD